MDKSLLKRAILKWGMNTQTHKLQEELLELALVINQLSCPTKPDMTDALIDELADVKIMMAQAEIMFGEELINERVRYKLNRMEEKYFQ